MVASYLAGAFYSRLVKRVLLVVPLSVLGQWQSELEKWASATVVDQAQGRGARNTTPAAGGLRLLVITSTGSKSQREYLESALNELLTSKNSGGIVLTTYGLIQSRTDLFSHAAFTHSSIQQWDLVIADEGHRIKNAETALYKCMRTSLPMGTRILLTGTPILNHLDEMWTLFDWATDSKLLGSKAAFKQEFIRPIMDGIAKNASNIQRHIGQALTNELRKRIAPYFLRRDKAILKQYQQQGTSKAQLNSDVKESDDPDADAISHSLSQLSIPSSISSSSSSSSFRAPPSFTVQKNDLILWLHLSPMQIQLYQTFLGSEKIRQLFMNTSRSPLVALSVLKKLCDHPRLLKEQMKLCEEIGEEIGQLPLIPESAESNAIELSKAVQHLCQESSKYHLLMKILTEHIATGHRTLVFSQSRRMLDLIELMLKSHGWKFLRIDGNVSDSRERSRRMELFQTDPSYPIFLLTTRAGGVGLNLTAADRVIIFDPDWTFSLDNQSVDRAYRLGQTRHVLIYRFITCSTIEEVIYRKQVFKGEIIRAATGASSSSSSSSSSDTTRYFTSQELREVFQFGDPFASATFQQLSQMHPITQRKVYNGLQQQLDVVEAFSGVHGLTDHDLLFEATALPSSTHDDVDSGSSSTSLLSPGERARRAIDRLNVDSSTDDFSVSQRSPTARRKKSKLKRFNERTTRQPNEFIFDLTQESDTDEKEKESIQKGEERQPGPIVNIDHHMPPMSNGTPADSSSPTRRSSDAPSDGEDFGTPQQYGDDDDVSPHSTSFHQPELADSSHEINDESDTDTDSMQADDSLIDPSSRTTQPDEFAELHTIADEFDAHQDSQPQPTTFQSSQCETNLDATINVEADESNINHIQSQLTPEMIDDYNRHIHLASTCSADTDAFRLVQLNHYLHACELSPLDPSLHFHIMRLARELNLFTSSQC